MSEPRPVSVSGYETLMELGRGGMGIAYLARSTGAGGFERLVVVKRLHQHMLQEQEALKRFLHEARLAAYVNHANVVDVQHADADASGPYMVLAYIEGASLDELTDRAALKERAIPVPILLRIALDVLTGLQAIHTARRPDGQPLRVLHRDLSPHNVLVGRDGVSRVADFGVAKSTLKTAETDRGYMVGKLLYIAPEYLKQEEVGPPLDVYGVGVSLWVTLAGKDPWPSADDVQMMTKIFTDGVPPIENSVDVPAEVAAIVNRACAIAVRDRYASAIEMAEAIEDLGRRSSLVASHGDVARFVEDLTGVDLERRRRAVAQIRSDVPASAQAAKGDATRSAIELTRPKQHDRTMSAVALAPKPPAAAPRMRWGLALVLLVGGIGVAAGFARNWMLADTPPAPSSARAADSPAESIRAPAETPTSHIPHLQAEDLPAAEPERADDRPPKEAPAAPQAPASRTRLRQPSKAATEVAPKVEPAPAIVEPPPAPLPEPAAVPADPPPPAPSENHDEEPVSALVQ